MIILQNKFICFQTKTFWMLHLNDNLYSKPCVFLWVANFRGLTTSFASLPTLSRVFTVGHICITIHNGAFTRGGIYPCLLLPNTYFHFHLSNRATLLDVVPLYRCDTLNPEGFFFFFWLLYKFGHYRIPMSRSRLCRARIPAAQACLLHTPDSVVGDRAPLSCLAECLCRASILLCWRRSALPYCRDMEILCLEIFFRDVRILGCGINSPYVGQLCRNIITFRHDRNFLSLSNSIAT